MDEEGHLHLKCSDGNMNGYNDICVTCLHCNMDIKYIGSGTAALAMVEYVTNYIAKLSLDSSTVFAALCGAIKTISGHLLEDPVTGGIDNSEHSQLVLLKTCNSMIGKHELSGQQVASFLCNIPNHFINHSFDKLWWSSIFNFTFKPDSVTLIDSDTEPHSDNVTTQYEIQSEVDDDLSEKGCDSTDNTMLPSAWLNDEDSYMLVDSVFTHNNTVLETLPPKCFAVSDMMFRPPSLHNMSLWEIFENYKRSQIPQQSSGKIDCDSAEKENMGPILLFHPNHPQHLTHCLKKCSKTITPVLLGQLIPHHTKEDDFEAYAAAVLTLFKPWTVNFVSPLKPPEMTWRDAFNDFMSVASPWFKLIIDNMQAVYECKDAAHDYAAIHRAHLTVLHKAAVAADYDLDDDSQEEDPFWSLATQTPETATEQDDAMDPDILDYTSQRGRQDTLLSLQAATEAGFYNYSTTSEHHSSNIYHGSVQIATSEDYAAADASHLNLMDEKQQFLQNLKAHQVSMYYPLTSEHHDPLVPNPYLTTLQTECEHICSKLQTTSGAGAQWSNLKPYQQLCLALVQKYTLNTDQTLAFLLYADHHAKKIDNPDLEPICMVIGGPGGTGKSQIFDVLHEFYKLLGHSLQLKVTAPTGLKQCWRFHCTL